jgi:hypothetical protein
MLNAQCAMHGQAARALSIARCLMLELERLNSDSGNQSEFRLMQTVSDPPSDPNAVRTPLTLGRVRTADAHHCLLRLVHRARADLERGI